METYSQFGEDCIIFDFFQRKTNGYFVEIGAHHPYKLSQTWLLEKNGWRGILIEPIPHLAKELREKRKNSKVFECGVSSPDKTGTGFVVIREPIAVSEVVFDVPSEKDYRTIRVRSLNDLFQEADCSRIDFLSIDIEGMEVEALIGMDFSLYRPKLILIEDHCHDLIKHDFLKTKGYKIVNRCGCNNWYIPKEDTYTGKMTVSKFEIVRKLYLGHPLKKFKRKFRSKKPKKRKSIT